MDVTVAKSEVMRTCGTRRRGDAWSREADMGTPRASERLEFG